MNSLRTTFFCLLVLSLCAPCFAQASGPDTRQITNPKSLDSESNSAARPLPIDDLYFTRSVSSASWSPNGKEIVFTTDISGRSNLWKVNASGGWPIQLAQSDERQDAETRSPDGQSIAFQPDPAGNHIPDLTATPT